MIPCFVYMSSWKARDLSLQHARKYLLQKVCTQVYCLQNIRESDVRHLAQHSFLQLRYFTSRASPASGIQGKPLAVDGILTLLARKISTSAEAAQSWIEAVKGESLTPSTISLFPSKEGLRFDAVLQIYMAGSVLELGRGRGEQRRRVFNGNGFCKIGTFMVLHKHRVCMLICTLLIIQKRYQL